jgi:hypothetical protein
MTPPNEPVEFRLDFIQAGYLYAVLSTYPVTGVKGQMNPDAFQERLKEKLHEAIVKAVKEEKEKGIANGQQRQGEERKEKAKEGEADGESLADA